jgi:hypothetical protein
MEATNAKSEIATGLRAGLMFRLARNAQEVIYFDRSKDLFRCDL